jgi:predicted glutamine amidotransferase
MCGIITYISKDKKSPAGEKVIEQFEDQCDRGQKGFGVVEITRDSVKVRRATEPVKALIDARLSTSPIMMFHHRTPTSTDNKVNQTHPIFVSHDELKSDWYVVHNGVIRNEKEMFTKHTEELGYVYTTLVRGKEKIDDVRYGASYSSSWKERDKFNDSEAFAIDLVRFLEGKATELETEGSLAFTALSIDKKTQKPQLIHWGRNETNPCEMFENKEGLLIASAVMQMTAVSAEANTYYIFDVQKFFSQKGGEITKCINQEPLFFKPKIVVEKTLPLPERTTTIGTTKNTSTANTTLKDTDGKVLTGKELKEHIEAEWGPAPEYQSERDEAFMKMSERIGQKTQELLDDLFINMAYNEISSEDIEMLTTTLHNMIVEREEKASSFLRGYYDSLDKAYEEQGAEDYALEQEAIMESIKESEVNIDEEAERKAREKQPKFGFGNEIVL